MQNQVTMDITEARRQFNSMDARLSEEPIIYVTRHGKMAFAVVDAECIAAMLETIEIMSDPEAYAAFQRSLDDIRAGRLHDHDDVMEELVDGATDHDSMD